MPSIIYFKRKNVRPPESICANNVSAVCEEHTREAIRTRRASHLENKNFLSNFCCSGDSCQDLVLLNCDWRPCHIQKAFIRDWGGGLKKLGEVIASLDSNFLLILKKISPSWNTIYVVLDASRLCWKVGKLSVPITILEPSHFFFCFQWADSALGQLWRKGLLEFRAVRRKSLGSESKAIWVSITDFSASAIFLLSYPKTFIFQALRLLLRGLSFWARMSWGVPLHGDAQLFSTTTEKEAWDSHISSNLKGIFFRGGEFPVGQKKGAVIRREPSDRWVTMRSSKLPIQIALVKVRSKGMVHGL